ncbi:hypothetical protein Glove_194g189 [Diversispora epigaea]|uniref:Uncharacterized protein n=1 Tax=Diversispora epigaea TaxID=1348612 RepID=A0A397IPL1_9GLOM|nr:hypothetical protein Glove_194g189 [Diversispora epigaea]
MKRQRSSTDEINLIPRKRIIIKRSASVLEEQQQNKQRILDEANRILQSLFTTRQNQPTFSIPDTSEIKIKKRAKGKAVENEDNNKANSSEVQAYHMLYEYKAKKATEYKHRSEGCDTKKGKISDYLEAFLCYGDAFYNQIKAHENGHHYDEFLNPENFFKSIHNWVKGDDKKLMGALIYLHAIVIKLYYGIKHEKCMKNSSLIRDEINKNMKNIKICEKKERESSLLFGKVRKLLSNQNLDISVNCLDNARTVARDAVNNWRAKEGVNFVFV